MKTNAPDKLYLSKNIYDTYLYQVPDPDDAAAVEYIRTDAFIEKAWDWIEDNLLSSNQQDKSCFYYEQFINYMEGE